MGRCGDGEKILDSTLLTSLKLLYSTEVNGVAGRVRANVNGMTQTWLAKPAPTTDTKSGFQNTLSLIPPPAPLSQAGRGVGGEG
ncbi:MAG: hypothetical protein KME17_16445 [Cyanosarcina radialis HA8281-LM2]|nr:hypothetical protein [Cyanosarcina radialis HA8281-LM2]